MGYVLAATVLAVAATAFLFAFAKATRSAARSHARRSQATSRDHVWHFSVMEEVTGSARRRPRIYQEACRTAGTSGGDRGTIGRFSGTAIVQVAVPSDPELSASGLMVATQRALTGSILSSEARPGRDPRS
jgi:hypothetical protein